MLTKKPEILKSVGLIASLSGAVTLWSVGAFAQGGPPPGPPPGGGGGTVECPADSLQDAIDGADSGGTVLFEGACTEDIVIQTDGLTLDGDPFGDTVVDGTIVGSVKVIGAQRVTLQNFDVGDFGNNGGGFEVGIEAVDGAAASVDNVAVSLTEDFAIGFYANLGSLLKVQDSSATLVVNPGECGSGAIVANANSLALSNGDNTFTVDDDTAICAANDSDYRQSSGTNDIVSSPRPAVSFV